MTDQELLKHLQDARRKYQNCIVSINKEIIPIVERLKAQAELENKNNAATTIISEIKDV